MNKYIGASSDVLEDRLGKVCGEKVSEQVDTCLVDVLDATHIAVDKIVMGLALKLVRSALLG